jgi:hypothetical protein
MDSNLLLIITPLLVIEIGLLLWGLWDLTRPGRQVRGDNKIIWAIVIVLIGFIGPVVYFLFGREET